eukprot:1944614-Amphidinium_carterae.1
MEWRGRWDVAARNGRWTYVPCILSWGIWRCWQREGNRGRVDQSVVEDRRAIRCSCCGQDPAGNIADNRLSGASGVSRELGEQVYSQDPGGIRGN